MHIFEPAKIADYRREREASERAAKLVTLEMARAAFVAKRASLAATLDRLRNAEGLKTRFDHARLNDLSEAIMLLDEAGLAPDAGLVPELVPFFESPEVVAVRKLLKSPSLANIESERERLAAATFS